MGYIDVLILYCEADRQKAEQFRDIQDFLISETEQ